MALAQRLMCVTVCHFLNGLAVLLVEWIGNIMLTVNWESIGNEMKFCNLQNKNL